MDLIKGDENPDELVSGSGSYFGLYMVFLVEQRTRNGISSDMELTKVRCSTRNIPYIIQNHCQLMTSHPPFQSMRTVYRLMIENLCSFWILCQK